LGSIRRRGILWSNPSRRALGQRVRSNRGGAAARAERSVAFHGRPAQARRSSARLVLPLMVWGREGSKTERMARGFSPGSSQRLGSRLCRVMSVRPFSVPRQPVVAPLNGPPVELWCGADQGSSGDPP
jgi:hypothetical protein